MAYQCMYQDKVLVALWSRKSINLFNCALTHTRPTTTTVICTDYKSKGKCSNRNFLEYPYDNIIPKNDEVEEEIIWSDGPTSEFKNKYMCHLFDKSSTKYNKRFLWKFSATSHGKGVVDGIGGNAKLIVQSQSIGKRTRSSWRMQTLSITLPVKQWMVLRFFNLIKPRLRHTGT